MKNKKLKHPKIIKSIDHGSANFSHNPLQLNTSVKPSSLDLEKFQRSIVRHSMPHSISTSWCGSENVAVARTCTACGKLSQRFVSLMIVRNSSALGRALLKCCNMPLNFRSLFFDIHLIVNKIKLKMEKR